MTWSARKVSIRAGLAHHIYWRPCVLRFIGLSCIIFVAGALKQAPAQTTYYSRDISGAFSLSTAAPNTTPITLSSQDIKNLNPGEFIVQQFPTTTGVPGTQGAILGGSTVTFKVWMKVTSTNVASFPRAKLFLNNTGGTQLCTATGGTALTTTLTQYTLTCNTASGTNIYLTTSDTFLLWVGFNTSSKSTKSLQGQLQVEGTSTSDSTVVVPSIIPPPTISSLSVSSGTPGTTVTITGSNFGSPQGSSTVKFNGVTAPINSWTMGSISANVPASTTGSVVVTVNGQASNGIAFTIPAPTISNVSPTTGRYGTAVTITGANFGGTQSAGSSTVTFGGTAGIPNGWADGTISVPVPNGAPGGTVSLTVTVGAQPASANFVVTPPPNITTLSQSSGPINTTITVTGSGFGSPQGNSTISFNGTTATPISWGPGSIIVPVPTGATTGPIVVSVGGQNSAGVTFTVTGGPSINAGGLSPSSGPAGTSVTITGSNFGGNQGNSVVKFNGLAAKATSWSSGTIHAPAPTGVSTGPVTVTVSGQTSNGVTFTALTTGSLTGTVTNSSNAAVSGATIQVLQNGASKATTATASNGTYSIASLPAGTYDVQASATGLGTALQNAVSVIANQTATQNFTLSSPGGITGKVTQSDGVTAISGASVQAFVGSAVASSTSTDSSGNYSLGNLTAGSYRTQASATGFVTNSQAETITGGSNTTANFSLQAPGTAAIQYDYDELGRLVGVVDTGGDVATYQYDAVGNILSISRQGSSQVSIVNFSPRTGPVGSTVTINGTGFSATPSQDMVKFNGTSATVVSATTTQIVTTVPTGATTGPISVTTPAGTATSGGNFTVGSLAGAPTITSFSPDRGLIGTAVTITGTNFDSTVANNRLTFNIAPASTSSVNPPTQLGTSVPPTSNSGTPVSPNVPLATSGRISLSTPNGTATGTQDFYVPFLSHVIADIGWTGRTTLGGSSQTVNLATPSKIGLLLFDGVYGQGGTIQLSSSTFASFQAYLFSPDGTQLQNSTFGTGSGTLATSTLPRAGTYTIGIDPQTNTGSVTISLLGDVSSALTIDGPPVTVTTTIANQDARLTFNGIAGERIVTVVTNVTNPSAGVNLVSPSGTVQGFVPGGINASPGHTFLIDTQTLTQTGTFQIWVQHSGSAVGSETVQLKSVPPDLQSTLTVPAAGATGTGSNIATTAIGQNGYLTFNAAAGQLLSFNVTSSTYPSGGCIWKLLDPSGTQIFGASCDNGFGDVPLQYGALRSTGTYTVFIDPQGIATGGATWSINNDADVTGTISIDGPSVTTGTAVPGQDARLSFSATSQNIVAYITNVTNPGATVRLVKPDGTNQGFPLAINNNPAGQIFFMDTQSLGTGTYQVWIQHNGANFGSETVQVGSVPVDATGTLTVPSPGTTGPATTLATTSAGQNGSLTFSGTTGQQLAFNISNTTYPSGQCFWTLNNPLGAQITGGQCYSSSFVDPQTVRTLTQTGTYTIAINPSGTATGSSTWFINNDADVTGSIAIDGAAVSTGTTVAGQDARLSFSASGQRIVVYITNVSNGGATVNLVTPSGSNQPPAVAINNVTQGQTFFMDTQSLGTGTYQLWVQHSSTNSGNETLQIGSVPADLSGSVTVNGSGLTFTTVAGQNANISFNNPQSQSVTVHWSSGTYPSNPGCNMFITNQSNSQVASGNCAGASGSFTTSTLAAGTYNIQVNPTGASTGGLTLTVTHP